MPPAQPGPVRRLALTLIALLGLIALAAPTAAQEIALAAPTAAQEIEPAPATTQVTVGAVLCPDSDCFAYDELLAGFTIAAIDTATGETLDTCTTDAADPHLCSLEPPADAQYDLAWNDTRIPVGSAWTGSFLNVTDGPIGTATLIPLAPVAQPEPGHVTVQAALCPDASCREITEFLDLFIITAVDPDTGEQFSSCATGNAQQGLDRQCILDVPADGNFALEWIPDQVPQGYAPLGDPFEMGDPAVLTLGFYRATDHLPVTPAPAITQLPSTGTGPDDPGIGLPAWLAGALAGLLALGGGTARLAPQVARVRRK